MSDRDREQERWGRDRPALADRLRRMGYDIVPPAPGEPPGASMVVRRDLGEKAVVVAVNAGGRFRADISWVVGEWPSEAELGGVPVRVIDAVSRAVTVTGQLDDPEQIVAVVADLGNIAPWASVAEADPGSQAHPE